jgi:hypothetical protein
MITTAKTATKMPMMVPVATPFSTDEFGEFGVVLIADTSKMGIDDRPFVLHVLPSLIKGKTNVRCLARLEPSCEAKYLSIKSVNIDIPNFVGKIHHPFN